MRCRGLILLVVLGLCPTLSYALTCSVSGVSSINFGTPTPLTAGTNSAQMTISYSCTKSVLEAVTGVTLCFNLGASANSGLVTTRTMSYVGPPASTLSYQLNKTASGTVWGSQYVAGTSPVLVNVSFLGSLLGISGTQTIYGQLTTPQVSAGPGAYTDNYSTATANYTVNGGLLGAPGVCGTTVGATFPFTVNATVNKLCTVTTNGNIAIGPVNSTAVNSTSNNSLSVTCTNSTPYTVGLVPSNSSTVGRGVMSGTGSNTDKVPYQLSSTPGPTGTVWGSSAANMVAGTGTGSALSYTVYATVPSANYTPDSYTDTVTVNVTY